MLRTILSENQYEPKFMMTAKTRPTIMPWPPPIHSPISKNNPLIAPSRIVVLSTFDMMYFFQILFYARFLEARDEAGHERGPVGERVEVDVLVQRVRAVANRAEPIKRWDAERCRQVAVRPAACAA